MSRKPHLVAVRPAPASEPPAAMRRRQTGPITQGALALRYQVGPDVSAVPEVPVLRLVGRDTDGNDLPDVRPWAARLVQAVAEVIAGDRPIGQLIRWTDGVVYAELNRRVRVLGLTTTASHRGSSERASVRSVHVFTPSRRAAEVAAHVQHGGRSRAVALRLELRRGRWICTALELG
jgi:hypothetical protein